MTDAASGPQLVVTGLTKRFAKRTVLDGLTFEVSRGEVLGFLGPNGAGKTTTFLCLCGLMRPDAGTIAFRGRPLGSDRGGTIALIPETPEVYPMLTVWEHLTFVARSLGLDDGWKARGEALLAQFAMTPHRDALGQTLSKGMRQKTLIAATVLADAPVLLLDEPMIGLDPRGQRELRDVIAEIRSAGTSVLMSTHALESAEAICDRLVIMKDGVAIASGATAEFRSRNGTRRSLEEIFLEITA